jgi:hypothetical protein
LRIDYIEVMGGASSALMLSCGQREQLGQWLAAYGTPQQVALHCRIVLAAARGGSDLSIAAGLDVNRQHGRLVAQAFC